MKDSRDIGAEWDRHLDREQDRHERERPCPVCDSMPSSDGECACDWNGDPEFREWAYQEVDRQLHEEQLSEEELEDCPF